MDLRRAQFLTGLFLTTLATLSLELLDIRLLSVLTWYHLSFFAVSTAMFGMSAGAVHVYLGGSRFEGERAANALGRFGTAFALSIPTSHVANLCIPIPVEISAMSIAALGLSTIFLAVPFYLSGVIVSIALTRIPGRIGLVYFADLLGASLGSLLVLPLLRWGNVSSAVLATGAIAALGAASLRCSLSRARATRQFSLAALLVALAVANSASPYGLRVVYPKGQVALSASVAHEFWSIHGQVVAEHPSRGTPPFWGPGKGASEYQVDRIAMWIDGAAGTGMASWDGDPRSLEWVAHDVTALPYHLRHGGNAAVIGVGGGRDLLTALWAGSRGVTGIEINGAFIHLLEGPLRDFANLADRSEVRLEHDEARSYLTRTTERFDVLQMSLIDTWAATGAGAFTLSENGLYTLEAWDVFLRTLRPGGLFSVSRWYSPERASETSRLISLATAALIQRGVADPRAHLALVARERVATLLASPDPFEPLDLERLGEVANRFGFDVLLAPGAPPAHPLLGRIAESRSLDEIRAVVENEPFDYTPPTDARPYFFNLLRPFHVFRSGLQLRAPGVVAGNLVATLTLLVLLVVSATLLAAIIFIPLARAGLPNLDARDFASSVLYFALIGAGYMLIQIGFMQRFSIYLGHPTYAVAVILFSMILATGVGSLLSDRLDVEDRVGWALGIPVGAAAILLGVSHALQPVIGGTIHLGLFARCLTVVGLVVPVSLLLGIFFPMGMRLVGRLSDDATPWMWGVNGACGVLASVTAVAISMWSGIQTNFHGAALAYLLLAVPAAALFRSGAVRAALVASRAPRLEPSSRGVSSSGGVR